MLTPEYTQGMNDRDFQSALAAMFALGIATAGDKEAEHIRETRFRMTCEAHERGFSSEKIEALRELGSKAQRTAFMID